MTSSPATSSRTALIVGASRGLGLGLAREYLRRGWRVIATERVVTQDSPLRALAAEAGDALRIEVLDINAPDQIDALARRLQGAALDLLFVNAGVSDDASVTIGQVGTAEFERVLVTNALSPLRVIERLDTLVAPGGTIAAMSSALGSVSDNTGGGYEVYRASKAALNTLLRSYAARAGGSRTLLAMVPGWVRTDMGGDQAPLDVATSVRGIADTVTAHEGRGGVAFVDHQGQTIAW